MKLLLKLSVLLILGTLLIPAHSMAGYSYNEDATYQHRFSSYDGSGSPADLGDLDHYHWYQWGIDWSIPDGEIITAARLIFENIYDTEWGDNYLHTHLLESSPDGLITGNDWNNDNSDYFDDYYSGTNYKLFTEEDIPYGSYRRIDIVYDFQTDNNGTDEVQLLMSYASDGNFGLGFDPDCHFKNSGVYLEIQTTPSASEPVPEPATMLLLSLGMFGLSGYKKIRKNRI